MYSTSRHDQHITTPVDSTPEYLVAPEELVSAPVLGPIPCVQELSGTVGPDVVGEFLCVFPGEWGTDR